MRKSYELVKVAFRALRKAGYIAKVNFMCCRSCAGASIANEVEAMPEEARAAVKGVALLTKQDCDDLNRRKAMYIAFGPVGTVKFGDVGQPSEVVGAAVCAALEAAGVVWEWDSSGSSCVRVDLAMTDTQVEVQEEVRARKAIEEIVRAPLSTAGAADTSTRRSTRSRRGRGHLPS